MSASGDVYERNPHWTPLTSQDPGQYVLSVFESESDMHAAWWNSIDGAPPSGTASTHLSYGICMQNGGGSLCN